MSLSTWLKQSVLATLILTTSISSFALSHISINIAQDGEALGKIMKDIAPYDQYLKQAAAKNAVVTFNEFAHKKLGDLTIVVYGVDPEDPKDSDEYKAVGYQAYPFTIMVQNTSDQPINFSTQGIELKQNGKIFERISDDELKALGEKHASKFWTNTLKGGVVLGALGVSVATGGVGIAAVGSAAGTASKLINHSLLNQIGTEMDSDSRLSDYQRRQEVTIPPQDHAYLYAFFKDFKPKDLATGAELTLSLNDQIHNFTFYTLPLDDFIDYQYSK